jgi:hypothetical protein
MLTIKNYHRLCDKPIGTNGWKVLFCAEGDNHYEIKLVCVGKISVTMCLERKAARIKNGENVYLFKRWDGTLTSVGITPSWIKDMSNLLKTLDNFTF